MKPITLTVVVHNTTRKLCWCRKDDRAMRRQK